MTQELSNEEPLSRKEILRRTALLCIHFTRNLAYQREGREGKRYLPVRSEFWITANGNFLDVCVLELSKLFGATRSDQKGSHFWKSVVTDGARFETEMFRLIDREQFDEMFEEARKYRNRFVAHLDDDRVGHIPHLKIAEDAVRFYYRYIQQNEARPDDLIGLPPDIDEYYEQCSREARLVYRP
jgi:hypothetical protein